MQDMSYRLNFLNTDPPESIYQSIYLSIFIYTYIYIYIEREREREKEREREWG